MVFRWPFTYVLQRSLPCCISRDLMKGLRLLARPSLLCFSRSLIPQTRPNTCPAFRNPFPCPPPNLYACSRSFASVMGNIRRITDELEKPETDDRSYRVIELSNKLEALLVHDPNTDKASASLNVNVGNLSDESDMPGMAHAVEHLLFMGTEKAGSPLTTDVHAADISCSIQ